MHYKSFDFSFNDIIGKSEKLESLIYKCKKVKDVNSPIIIIGETGTGKDLIARSIHYESKRQNYKYVPINCAAIPESIMESILFGYEPGTFTGANPKGQIGEFELANGGTLFLDEIGDMSLSMQSKLLRVLETKTYRRLGGSNVYESDFRLISATNKELHKLVEDGKFRKDLLYRINTIPLYVPSLNERIDDIPLLANYFLDKLNFEYNDKKCFAEESIKLLIEYKWDGNIRELKNVIEYTFFINEDDHIKIEDFPDRFKNAHRKKQSFIKNNPDCIFETEDVTPISTLEKREIKKALRIYSNKTTGLEKAAYELGMSLSTLYRKIKLYGIQWWFWKYTNYM